MLPEIHPSGWALLFDAALRLWLLASGLAVAAHYHCMANFMTAAPHWVRAVTLPVLTAAGVGMVFCSITGQVGRGALFGLLAAGVMPLVQLAAWGAGAYVSEQLARADRMKRYRHNFLRSAVGGAEHLADLLDADSAPAPLQPGRAVPGIGHKDRERTP